LEHPNLAFSVGIPLRTAAYLVGMQHIAFGIGEKGTQKYYQHSEENN